MATATKFKVRVYPIQYRAADGGGWSIVFALTKTYPSTILTSTNVDTLVRDAKKWAEQFGLPANVSITVAVQGDRKPRGFDAKIGNRHLLVNTEDRSIDSLEKALSAWDALIEKNEAA